MPMSKLGVITNILKSYMLSKNEWFINYKLSLYLFVTSLVTFSLYIIFGEYSFYSIFYNIVLLLMFGHIILSVLAVINDYTFESHLKVFFKGLWLLISLRVIFEVFIF